MYEVTMQMIIRDNEMSAFKDLKYMVKREVKNPKDLVERQKSIIKGIDIQQPHQSYMTTS